MLIRGRARPLGREGGGNASVTAYGQRLLPGGQAEINLFSMDYQP